MSLIRRHTQTARTVLQAAAAAAAFGLAAPGVASALPSLGNSAASAPGQNICVSANGHTMSHGTATCSTTSGNIAMAKGENTYAAAEGGSRNRATATGTGSMAYVVEGTRNTATATNGGQAVAGYGYDNTATDGSTAAAAWGSNNTVTGTNGGQAGTLVGSNNTVTADGCHIEISNVDGQTVSCP